MVAKPVPVKRTPIKRDPKRDALFDETFEAMKDNPDSLSGINADKVWFDEAKDIPESTVQRITNERKRS